jgi:hypothetical protein
LKCYSPVMCFCHHARNSERIEPLFALRHFIEVINIPRFHAPALECIRALPHTFGANHSSIRFAHVIGLVFCYSTFASRWDSFLVLVGMIRRGTRRNQAIKGVRNCRLIVLCLITVASS